MEYTQRITFTTFDEMFPLSEMEDNPYQTNTHTESQIKQLAKIMRVQGIDHAIHLVRVYLNNIAYAKVIENLSDKKAELLNG